MRKTGSAARKAILVIALFILTAVGTVLAAEYPSQVYGPFFVGTKIYSGTGAPDSATGLNGDYYIDTVSGNLYNKNSGGSWQLLMNIIGPQGMTGAKGSSWWSGIAPPLDGMGNDNDYYLNTVSGNIYNRTGGSWQLLLNIMGPQGPPGLMGPANMTAGPIGPQGIPGEANMTAGPQGIPGEANMTAGPIGPQGIPGEANMTAGPQGIPGEANMTAGPQGIPGEANMTAGPMGPEGPMGPANMTAGPIGPQGIPGEANMTAGPMGPQGIPGEANMTAGPQGIPGEANMTAGPIGPQGIPGEANMTAGPMGPQGIPGEANMTAGPMGPQGTQGEQGPKGDTGATGAQGNPGPNQVTTSTTTTLTGVFCGNGATVNVCSILQDISYTTAAAARLVANLDIQTNKSATILEVENQFAANDTSTLNNAILAANANATLPSTSTANDVVTFSDTTGKILKDSGTLISSLATAAGNLLAADLHIQTNASATLLNADSHIQTNLSAGTLTADSHIQTNLSAGILTADSHIATNASATLLTADSHISTNLTSSSVAVLTADQHIASNKTDIFTAEQTNRSADRLTEDNNIGTNLSAGKLFTSQAIISNLTIAGNTSVPASSVTNDLVAFTDTTGHIFKDSGVLISSLITSVSPVTKELENQFTANDTSTLNNAILAANANDTSTANSVLKSTWANATVFGNTSFPTSSINNDIAVFSGTLGHTLADSGTLISSLISSVAPVTKELENQFTANDTSTLNNAILAANANDTSTADSVLKSTWANATVFGNTSLPASSTDMDIALFSGTGGHTLVDSGMNLTGFVSNTTTQNASAIPVFGAKNSNQVGSTNITITGTGVAGPNTLDMGLGQVRDMGTPTASTDAATKGYTDSGDSGVRAYVDYNQTNRVVPNGSVLARNASIGGSPNPNFNLSTTDTLITFSRGSGDLNFTLPSAGTYLLHADIPFNWTGCSVLTGPAFESITLFDAGIVTGSRRNGLQVPSRPATGWAATTTGGDTIDADWIYTASGAVTLKVYGRYNGVCTGGWVVVADPWRAANLVWMRIV